MLNKEELKVAVERLKAWNRCDQPGCSLVEKEKADEVLLALAESVLSVEGWPEHMAVCDLPIKNEAKP
jgi:hypothetical protein